MPSIVVGGVVEKAKPCGAFLVMGTVTSWKVVELPAGASPGGSGKPGSLGRAVAGLFGGLILEYEAAA